MLSALHEGGGAEHNLLPGTEEEMLQDRSIFFVFNSLTPPGTVHSIPQAILKSLVYFLSAYCIPPSLPGKGLRITFLVMHDPSPQQG